MGDGIGVAQGIAVILAEAVGLIDADVFDGRKGEDVSFWATVKCAKEMGGAQAVFLLLGVDAVLTVAQMSRSSASVEPVQVAAIRMKLPMVGAPSTGSDNIAMKYIENESKGGNLGEGCQSSKYKGIIEWMGRAHATLPCCFLTFVQDTGRLHE